jgi:short-subunit dehydrogenase
MARKGARVVLAARNSDLLKSHVQRILSEGGRALAVQTDVSNRSQVKSLIALTIKEFGQLNILVNNAGVSPARGIILENTEEDVRKTMDVNFMGSLYGVWEASPYLEKSGQGMIVFVSSIIGKRGIPKNAAYCASKFAIQGLAESIRPELKKRGIHVLTVCPAGVDTEFYRNNGKSEKREYTLHAADKIAKMIVRACEKEARELLPTWDAKILNQLSFYFPKLMDRLIAKSKGV